MTAADFDRALTVALPTLRINALRLAKNATDADDLMQATALQAVMFRERYAEIGNMRAWLARIMMNQFLNWTRMAKCRIQTIGVDDLPEGVAMPRGEHAVAVAQVARAILKLPEIHRSAISQQVDGLTYEEMAAAEGVQCGTIKSRLNRARAALNAMGEFV